MAERAPEWAYYSEDRGLQGPADPELILIVDPIDGTRPAAAGFEMACVSVAAVPPVAHADDGRRGRRRAAGDQDRRPLRRREGRRLHHEAGRRRRDPAPAHRRVPTSRASSGRSAFAAAPQSSSRASSRSSSTSLRWAASVFDIGSATYSITRVLTGQLDAYVDIGPAIIDAHPGRRSRVQAGRARQRAVQLALRPGRRRICSARRPASRSATLPAGRSTTSRCWARTPTFQMACIASGNAELQAALVDVVQRGIRELRYEA